MSMSCDCVAWKRGVLPFLLCCCPMQEDMLHFEVVAGGRAFDQGLCKGIIFSSSPGEGGKHRYGLNFQAHLFMLDTLNIGTVTSMVSMLQPRMAVKLSVDGRRATILHSCHRGMEQRGSNVTVHLLSIYLYQMHICLEHCLLLAKEYCFA